MATDKPDLDTVIVAFARLLDATTYAAELRRIDEITIGRDFQHRPDSALAARTEATQAQRDAATALYEALDHERAMQLIPSVSGQHRVEARAERAYAELQAYAELAAQSADEDGAGT